MLAYIIGSFVVSDLAVSRNKPNMVLIDVKNTTHNTWKPVLDFSFEALQAVAL